MIETERQRDAAAAWILYWTLPGGGQQSWLGQETVRQELAELRRSIDEYDRRVKTDKGAAPA